MHPYWVKEKEGIQRHHGTDSYKDQKQYKDSPPLKIYASISVILLMETEQGLTPRSTWIL